MSLRKRPINLQDVCQSTEKSGFIIVNLGNSKKQVKCFLFNSKKKRFLSFRGIKMSSDPSLYLNFGMFRFTS